LLLSSGCGHGDKLDSIENDLAITTQNDLSPASNGDRSTPEAPMGETPAPSPPGEGTPATPTDTSTPSGPAHDPITFEPNDTPGTAAPLELNQRAELVSLTEDTDEFDYYRTAVRAGATYTLDIANPRACYLYYSIGLGSDGQRAALVPEERTSSGGNLSAHVVREFTAPDSGPVLLTIVSSGLGAGCSQYSVAMWSSTIDGLEHDAITREPNDSNGTAAPIDVGQTYERLTLARPLDTTDIYRVPSSIDGQRYTLEIDNSQRCSLSSEVWAQREGGNLSLLPSLSLTDANANVLRTMSRPFTAVGGLPLLVQLNFRNVFSDGCDAYAFAVRVLE
jgi:hypothetical protein